MSRSVREILTKFLLFSLSTVAGTLVDLGLHWLQATYLFDGHYWGSYWVAPTVSFEAATVVNFVIAYFFIWKERVSCPSSVRSFFRHLAGYNVTCVGAFLIKLVAMQGFHFLFLTLGWFQQYSIEPALCNLLSMSFSGVFNFVMNEFVVFQRKK